MKPHELGAKFRQLRDARFSSRERKLVCIGWHGQLVRICDDDGAIDYSFRDNGRICRTSHGGYNRDIETFDMLDASPLVDSINAEATP